MAGILVSWAWGYYKLLHSKKRSLEQMLKRHKIGEAPVWQQKLTVFIGALFAATLLLFAVWAITLFINTAAIDDCRDKSGSYDFELGRCDFDVNQPNP